MQEVAGFFPGLFNFLADSRFSRSLDTLDSFLSTLLLMKILDYLEMRATHDSEVERPLKNRFLQCFDELFSSRVGLGSVLTAGVLRVRELLHLAGVKGVSARGQFWGSNCKTSLLQEKQQNKLVLQLKDHSRQSQVALSRGTDKKKGFFKTRKNYEF